MEDMYRPQGSVPPEEPNDRNGEDGSDQSAAGGSYPLQPEGTNDPDSYRQTSENHGADNQGLNDQHGQFGRNDGQFEYQSDGQPAPQSGMDQQPWQTPLEQGPSSGNYQQANSYQQPNTYQQPGAYQQGGAYQQPNGYQQGGNPQVPGAYPMPGGNAHGSMSALAISGFAVSVAALVLCWLLTFVNVLVLIGLGLSIAGIVATGAGKGRRGRGLAIAGTVIAGVALVSSVLIGSFYVGAIGDSVERSLDSYSSSSSADRGSAGKSVSSDAKINGFESGQHAVVNIGDGYVGTTESGDKVLVVVYKLKNTGDSTITFSDMVMDTAEQDGDELDISYDSDLQNIVSGDTSKFVDDTDVIKPGQEVSVIRGYVLDDSQKAVTIYASGWKSAGSETVSNDFQLN